LALIDIGSPAINRASSAGARTLIIRSNPANNTGKITSVELWFEASSTQTLVGTSYVVNGNNLSTRDYENIGAVTAGSKQTFTVDIDVQTGDYLGIDYSSPAYLERDVGTGLQYWYLLAPKMPFSDLTFLYSSSSALYSMYGTGITAPSPPTNVSATDGTYTDKVTITWTKSSEAADYQVYRDGTPLGWLGDVGTYDDTGANAPTITVGTASASDETSSDYVTLSVAGESVNNGTVHTYKVRAKNAAGESGDSATNTGYRGVGALIYQWQRSAGDSDADYSNISGATTDPYNDTEAPVNGDGRYYKCVENATGAAEVTTNADRGYRLALTGNAIFFGCNF